MLITCSECGKSVSDKAKSCPNCGVPIEVIGATFRLSDRKRSVAVVFAIFLGILGSHNAYLGYNKKSTIELILGVIGLLTIPVFGLGCVLLFFLWIWGIVEVFSYKADGEGRLLR
jgi:TM2 domain-containing membrane protein YozV